MEGCCKHTRDLSQLVRAAALIVGSIFIYLFQCYLEMVLHCFWRLERMELLLSYSRFDGNSVNGMEDSKCHLLCMCQTVAPKDWLGLLCQVRNNDSMYAMVLLPKLDKYVH